MPTRNARSLRETKRGRLWLQNFENVDRQTAKLLLDAVSVIASTDFRADLKTLLQTISIERADQKLAAYAIQQVPMSLREDGYYTDLSELTPSGSELVVQNVLNKARRTTRFKLNASVKQLRRAKTDVIIFVADIVSSGSEVFDFLDYFYRNPTIRSWHSSRHVEFAVVAHTISERAWRRLAADKRIAEVKLSSFEHNFHRADWTDEERVSVISLCERYSDDSEAPLGWKRSMSLTVMGHTFGNGLPRILLQSRARDARLSWSPLLPRGRDFGLDPADEKISAGYSGSYSVVNQVLALSSKGEARTIQKQEAIALNSATMMDLEKPIVELLVALRLGYEAESDLMRVANMSATRLETIRDAAEDLGLISAEMRVTSSGNALVQKMGRESLNRHHQARIQATEYYYPLQLG